MKFVKFTSLENTYRQRVVDEIYKQGLDDGTWIVQSKIDGANLGVYYDGKNIRIASRQQFVSDGFFNCHAVIEKYLDQIKYMGNMALKHDSNPNYVIIRGELYGKGIQNRVYYGADRDLCVFDIDLVTDDKVTTLPFSTLEVFERRTYLEFPNRKPLKLAPVLAIYTTFEEAFLHSPDFKSKLTPEDYDKDNWEEGIIIRPNQPKVFGNGRRVFLKHKSKYFEEKITKKRATKEPAPISNSDQVKLEASLEYLTESRVYSAISKLGQVTHSSFGPLLKEVVSDVYKDYNEDNGVCPLQNLDDKKEVMRIFNREASIVVRTVFKKEVLK